MTFKVLSSTKMRVNMKNEHEKLSFIKALIDQLDHHMHLPVTLYFNYYSPIPKF